MPITLSEPLLAWLQAEVARGHYGSLDAAIEAIVATHVAQVNEQRLLQERVALDPALAVGLVDQVRTRIAQGESETVHAFASFVQKKRGTSSTDC